MKSKKQIIVGIIILLMLLIPTITKANIEVKPGSTAWTQVTATRAYEECYNLGESYSSLGNNSLDPHLVLNGDWGAVAYLAISAYGKVTNSTGPRVKIGNTTYTTTTGNETGVMNFGKAYTFTSAGHKSGLSSASRTGCRTNLINNKDTRYVELMPTSASTDNTKGMAISETIGWFSSTKDYCSSSYPMVYRTGVLGFSYNVGYWSGEYYGGYGHPSAAVFRPAIWNIER